MIRSSENSMNFDWQTWNSSQVLRCNCYWHTNSSIHASHIPQCQGIQLEKQIFPEKNKITGRSMEPQKVIKPLALLGSRSPFRINATQSIFSLKWTKWRLLLGNNFKIKMTISGNYEPHKWMACAWRKQSKSKWTKRHYYLAEELKWGMDSGVVT